jgi:methylated-DNA-[protein]-cysteine S-methyltransferase
MKKLYAASLDTPVGRFFLQQEGDHLVRTGWGGTETEDDTPLLNEATRQIESYFAGALEQFDLPLAYYCSDFQRRACEEMLNIPFGETITYAELAERLGSSAQAAGNACGGNPLPIVVPCHRVLGTNNLGGYSGEGGIETKIALLKIESPIPWLI